MHEAAGLIQTQVDLMMQDVNRLDERVSKLANHFSQAERDITDIQTSTRKITGRGDKIAEIEIMDAAAVTSPSTPSATSSANVTVKAQQDMLT
jgi:DNA recombination protein RmuC